MQSLIRGWSAEDAPECLSSFLRPYLLLACAGCLFASSRVYRYLPGRPETFIAVHFGVAVLGMATTTTACAAAAHSALGNAVDIVIACSSVSCTIATLGQLCSLLCRSVQRSP